MAEEMSHTTSEGYPMKGGDGEYSYFIHSSRQRCAADTSKGTLVAKIVENLAFENLSSTTVRIADLGCSVGPNTFIAVETIIEAQYFAAAVPGSFHGRLFPKASLDIVYSAYAIQWLSKTPQELLDSNSPAFNKGRILYGKSPDEVAQAYGVQYAKDIQCFLRA
ncbi:putative loganate O-methyltransferase [Rosa chinensis]|uniref:Putative loganate O-methyltransferase n=1 Tax=Rosa chinensis TaxID=74649 RepID=A0A2P6P200_ROSCH|nr:putative loganate O-methyltransferase [Rosa chinensis]